VKINLTGAITYPQIVREKHDGQAPRQDHSHPDQKNQKNESENQDEPLDEESVGRAVAEFLADKQTQANGLSATVAGHGPGLKVVLKDIHGGVVRQLSGGEFLKLRHAVSKESPLPGKILDQKL
jgi:hypothetical protein